ncbi:MAG: class I tRNA ligase family protein, partial [Candidatus Heimdallarchaeota archaeon]|nr:class I tRNA ligase family protein [Candidatus Heimdallarchaeota archaeon]
YTGWNFNKAILEIMEVSSIGNKFFQDNTPWQLRKDGKDDEAKKVCAVCLNIVKNLSILISPVLPVFSKNLQQQLNAPNLKWDHIGFDMKDHKIGKAQILVQKVEKIEEEKFPLNLKVAEIKEANNHPDSEKLVIIQVDIGEDKPRQIVAGIQKYYKAEELIGKKIIIVSNLKPAKLGGEISNGMLLAASSDDEELCILLEAPGSNPGDEVSCGDMKNLDSQIKYDQFAKLKLEVKDGKILVENFNSTLNIKGKDLSTDAPDGLSIS